uniref:Uncharacterized protein n=1 Tax=viral metagenome TaxID=1070528 RepID=A0A6H1ZY62_9ZZZZ
MTTEHRFYVNGDRYALDFNGCSYKKGYAQIDTDQDAWYFGTWANPTTRTIVNYAEGDLTIERAETDAEFASRIRDLAKWNADNGYTFGIDPMCNAAIEAAFRTLGLGDLLH